MNELAALLLTALYYTLFLPVHTLFRGLALVLTPVYYGLQFVLLPFIYLAHIVWRILVLPFVLLAKLETLYIFLGVAGIIGVFAGGVLYFSFSLLKSTFNLDSYDDVYGVTAAEYRAARRKRKAEESYAEAPILVGHGRPKDFRFLKPRDVLVQTILEEDDSDY